MTQCSDSNRYDFEDPEDDFEERRHTHMAQLTELRKYRKSQEQACLHLTCPNCFGTGTRSDGSPCVHMMSCSCPRCTPH